MAPIRQSHNAHDSFLRLLHSAAEIYGAPGDPAALAIAEGLRGTRSAAGRTPGDSPAALKHLTRALEDMPPGPMAAPIRDCAASLPWFDRAFPKSKKMAGCYAFVEIAGPNGVVLSDVLRFGLYLQSPRRFYPAHNHEAAEHYHVVSGTAKWQKDDAAFQAMPPGVTIYHAPWQRHAMETGREALLALWVWTGNLDPGTYRLYDG